MLSLLDKVGLPFQTKIRVVEDTYLFKINNEVLSATTHPYHWWLECKHYDDACKCVVIPKGVIGFTGYISHNKYTRDKTPVFSLCFFRKDNGPELMERLNLYLKVDELDCVPMELV